MHYRTDLDQKEKKHQRLLCLSRPLSWQWNAFQGMFQWTLKSVEQSPICPNGIAIPKRIQFKYSNHTSSYIVQNHFVLDHKNVVNWTDSIISLYSFDSFVNKTPNGSVPIECMQLIIKKKRKREKSLQSMVNPSIKYIIVKESMSNLVGS